MSFLNPSQATLNKFQSLSIIASSVAIPILIALFGYWIQTSIADKDLRKDYVQMAIGILADSSTDPELKKWAVEIVAKNSPIRFSDNLEDKLRMGSTLKIFAHLNIVPNDLLQPPLQLLPNEPGNANENYKRSRENSRKLTELQEWVRISKTK